MKHICLFLLLFTAMLVTAQKKPSSKNNTTAVFDEYIQKSIPLWQTTGMAVGVVKDGVTIFKKGYGVTEIGSSQPFTTSTIAFCASTTKAMTAACIAMLVDEGKLNWDDKLKKILPSFRLYDAYVSDEITVKDLLTHNTGLGNGDLLWLFGYPADEILRRMQFMQPAYSLRSSFIYQNLMYVVAGEVIKKVSGLAWNQFIKERIFKPLGMQHTYTLFTDAVAEPSRMTPHFFYGDTLVKAIPVLDFGEYDPAGSVVSNIDDITRWMKFLQDSAVVNGQRLISAQNFEMLFKPHAIIPANEFYPTASITNPHWITYGLGWFQQDYRGKMIQFHTGSLDGSVAIFGFVPEDKLSFYFFGNLDHTEIRHALMWKAIDLWAFNDNSRDWSTTLHTMYKSFKDSAQSRQQQMEAKRILNTSPSLALQQYAGKYSNPIYGDATIELQDGKLNIRFPNNIYLYLQHWQHNTFRGMYNYEWFGKSYINFLLATSGEIESFDFDGIVYSKQ
ncbi:MAG: hypothetical protein RL172_661 [Bacteroidota bacterium]|jgi:CubicO group peptidase (beta-lactamase class C family)